MRTPQLIGAAAIITDRPVPIRTIPLTQAPIAIKQGRILSTINFTVLFVEFKNADRGLQICCKNDKFGN